MKKIILFAALNFAFFANAHADVLTGPQADAICHQRALAGAHFMSDSNKQFYVSYVVSTTAEISTPITYSYAYEQGGEVMYTVDAYAYPDDNTCLLGVITNNIAGND